MTLVPPPPLARGSSAAGALDSPAPNWTAPRSRAQILGWVVLPVLLAVFGYAATLDGYFQSDDFEMLETAARAPSWSAASRLAANPEMSWLRPIGHWVWKLQWELHGAAPLAYRALNLALHALDAVLVAWLAGVLAGRVRAGVLAGAAFALLPIHPEAVTWLSGRFDLLCTTGALVALLSCTRYLALGGARWLGLAGAGLLLAMGSKEMGFAVAPLAACLAFGFFGRPRRRTWLALALLFGLTALYFAYRAHTLGGLGGIQDAAGDSIHRRFDFSDSARFLAHAAWMSFAPAHGELHPGRWTPIALVPAICALLLFLSALVLERGTDRRRTPRALFIAGSMFAVSLLPISNWASLSADFESTRYLYLSSVFSSLALGFALGRGPRRLPVALALGALCVAMLGAWTVQLLEVNAIWRRASFEARDAVAAFPTADEDSTLWVTGLPDNDQGAFVLRSGLKPALRLLHGNELEIHIVDETTWSEQRAAARPRTPWRFLRWDPAARAWTDD